MSKKIAVTLAALALAANLIGEEYLLKEDFKKDPFGGSGRWTVLGPGLDQFEYTRDSGPAYMGDKRGSLTVLYDSSRPTTRMETPLGAVLDGSTPFRLGAVFTIEEVEASEEDFFQISFGAGNSATTGLNRTGTTPYFGDADTFDHVEFSYYPNVSFWGGPNLTPTVFGSEPPFGDAFFNFAALFGSEADLGDNEPPLISELPLHVPIRADLVYDPVFEELTLSLHDLSGRSPVELPTGLVPLDLSFVNLTDTFEIDTFTVTSFFDYADWDPSTLSLRAVVRYDLLYLTVPGGDDEDEEGDEDEDDDAFNRFRFRGLEGGSVR